jgi:succinoglycan biosynthesis transport protein ExoP
MKLQFVLLDLSDTLRRRRLYLLVPFAAVCILGILAAYLLPEEYESFSTVIVQRNGIVLPPEGQGTADPLGLFREIVRSRYTLEAVAESLRAATPSAGRPSLEEQTALLGSAITAEQRGTDACRITALHEDPETARRIAEVVTAVALNASGQGNRRQLDETVRLFEEKLARYEKETAGRTSSASTGEGGTPADAAALRGALGRTGTELQEAEAAGSDVERSLMVIRSSIATLDDPATISRLSSVDNRVGRAFAGGLRTLAARYADLLTRYRLLHPEVQSVRRQLVALLDKTAAALETEHDAAQSRVTELRTRQHQLHARLALIEPGAEGLARKTPVAETSPETLADLRRQLEQARTARELNVRAGSTIAILDRPQRPSTPVSPDRPFIISLAAIVGVFIGIIALIIAELLDTTIRRPGDLEVFGKPVIATLP